MVTYIALLRGINVSGQKLILMEELRSSIEALGMVNVRTYIQSGNIVFNSKKPGKESPKSLSEKIHDQILDNFGFEVVVIIRTATELKRIIEHNPFLKEKPFPDVKNLYTIFLSHKPKQSALLGLNKWVSPQDQFRHHELTIYLHLINGYGKTKLSNSNIEKILSLQSTARNWNTVTKLYEMSIEKLTIKSS